MALAQYDMADRGSCFGSSTSSKTPVSGTLWHRNGILILQASGLTDAQKVPLPGCATWLSPAIARNQLCALSSLSSGFGPTDVKPACRCMEPRLHPHNSRHCVRRRFLEAPCAVLPNTRGICELHMGSSSTAGSTGTESCPPGVCRHGRLEMVGIGRLHSGQHYLAKCGLSAHVVVLLMKRLSTMSGGAR